MLIFFKSLVYIKFQEHCPIKFFSDEQLLPSPSQVVAHDS